MTKQHYSFDAFISSSAADQPVAQRTAALLQKAGLRVWHQGGADASDNAEYQIKESLKQARVLVQVLSPSALNSEWPALEERTYQFRDPTIENRQFVILAVQSMQLPNSIAQAAVIDWSDDKQVDNLARLVAICTPPAEKPTSRGVNVRREAAGKAYSLTSKLVSCLKRIPSRELLAIGSHTGEVTITSINSPSNVIKALAAHEGPVTALTTDPTASTLFTASIDRSIKVWDLSTFEKRHQLLDVGGQVTALHTEGSWIFAGMKDGNIKSWQHLMDIAPRMLRGHSATINAIACAGQQVITASSDSTIRVWNRVTGQCLRVLEGHVNAVLSLAVSPDGRLLCSGSADRKVGTCGLLPVFRTPC